MSLDPTDLTIQFAHPAYRLAERFAARETGIRHFQTHDAEETARRVGEADILVLSGLWRPDLLPAATRLRFIQVCAVGTDQFDRAALAAAGVRLANAAGVNAKAVSDHALGLLLSLSRQLPQARDNQRKAHWRGMIADRARREDELAGKTVLVYGLGAIGGRIARLCQAFEMTVLGIRRQASEPVPHVDEVHPPDAFPDLLPRCDALILCCPLTDETRNLVDRATLAALPGHAFVINVARGGCLDEDALVAALRDGTIAGAAIDVTAEEPLPTASPLWGLDNLLLTPHSGGETRRYEDNVIDVLIDNIDRLARGEEALLHQIV